MDKRLELNELIYEVPNLFVRGVENVCSVFVHEDIVLVFAVAVTARMATPINNQYPLTRLMGTIGDYGTI